MNKFDLDTKNALVTQADMQEQGRIFDPRRILHRHLILVSTASVIALALVALPAKLDPNTLVPTVSSAFADSDNGQGDGDETKDRDRDQVDDPDQDQDQDHDQDQDQNQDRDHDGADAS